MNISKLAVAITEDVNKEESIIVNFFGKIVKGMNKIILLVGFPYILYLLFQMILQG